VREVEAEKEGGRKMRKVERGKEGGWERAIFYG
jgi:hypothetical protein